MAKTYWSFAVTFVALFVLAFAVFGALDLLPDPISNHASTPVDTSVEVTNTQNFVAELPVRVVAAKVGLDVSVANPDSTDVEALDEDLLKGAVRYPTSAQLGVDGTVLLFGHSSYLPIVHNQNFKAFNGIQNLKTGDVVSVYSGTLEYRYRVTSVRLANATEDVVELPATGKFLTLVTCDSFGTKSQRYIVTADFVGAYQSSVSNS